MPTLAFLLNTNSTAVSLASLVQKVFASFKLPTGREQHVMCVVEKAWFEPRTLGTGAERASNCATAPVHIYARKLEYYVFPSSDAFFRPTVMQPSMPCYSFDRPIPPFYVKSTQNNLVAVFQFQVCFILVSP